jgi:hypothetical protein
MISHTNCVIMQAYIMQPEKCWLEKSHCDTARYVPVLELYKLQNGFTSFDVPTFHNEFVKFILLKLLFLYSFMQKDSRLLQLSRTKFITPTSFFNVETNAITKIP